MLKDLLNILRFIEVVLHYFLSVLVFTGYKLKIFVIQVKNGKSFLNFTIKCLCQLQLQ